MTEDRHRVLEALHRGMRLQMAYLPMGWLVAGRSWTMIWVPFVCQRLFHLPYLAFHLWRLVCLMPAAFYANLIPHLPMILVVNIPKVFIPHGCGSGMLVSNWHWCLCG
jgi:hypothetical protein